MVTAFLRSVSGCLDSAIATVDVHRFAGVRTLADMCHIPASEVNPRFNFNLKEKDETKVICTLKIKPAEIHGSQNAFFRQLQDCILNPCADERARACACVQFFGCFLFGQRTARALHESCGSSPSQQLHRMIFSRVRSSLSLVATFPPTTEANLKALTTFFKFPLLCPSPFPPPF
jgi:hypothetical protein